MSVSTHMVAMRDGIRLATDVHLPDGAGPFPVIMERTPYGRTETSRSEITAANRTPASRAAIAAGFTSHGYAVVYQDTRGRYGSEGEDHVYGDDAEDGYDTLEWIANQPWTNQMVGMSGSSAGATTTFAAASQRHPSLRAFFIQVGASSIYDDVVCEGQSIEMERLWLWVSKNIPGLSPSHREAVMQRSGLTAAQLDAAAVTAGKRYARLEAARQAPLPFIESADWMRLPLTGYPDFATWQPYLDEIITGAFGDSDAFRSRCRWRSNTRAKVPLYLAQRSANISLPLHSYHQAPERLSRT